MMILRSTFVKVVIATALLIAAAATVLAFMEVLRGGVTGEP